jgi:hypothetical protein
MRSKRLTKEDMRDADKLVILHESTLQSWSKDIFTFGGIIALAWLNTAYIHGSWLIDAFAVFAFGIMGVNRSWGFAMTVDELRLMLAKPAARSAAEEPGSEGANN